MKRWNFQILPNIPNIIGVGYRMDETGEEIESIVNDAMPRYLKFHGVNKIVIKLGPSTSAQDKDYVEILGVGTKQYRAFDIQKYRSADIAAKRALLMAAVNETFDWITLNYSDADFIAETRQKLLMTSSVLDGESPKD